MGISRLSRGNDTIFTNGKMKNKIFTIRIECRIKSEDYLKNFDNKEKSFLSSIKKIKFLAIKEEISITLLEGKKFIVLYLQIIDSLMKRKNGLNTYSKGMKTVNSLEIPSIALSFNKIGENVEQVKTRLGTFMEMFR